MKLSYCAVGLFILMFAGCKDSGTPTESESSPNLKIMNVVYTSDQTFTLELELLFDSGYSWSHEFSNPELVRLDSVKSRPTTTPPDGRRVVGGSVYETYYFHTLAPGKCSITLTESRGWEKNVPPLYQVQLNVTIN